MDSFNKNFMNSYIQHAKNFDKWCRYAAPILGPIRQCGIIVLEKSGYAYIAANNPKIGQQNLINQWYLHEPHWHYHKNLIHEFDTYSTQFGYMNSSVYKPEFRMSWMTHRTVIDENTQQICFFGSNSPMIYSHFVNKLTLIKPFLRFFIYKNQTIMDTQKIHKFNLAQNNKNYLRSSNHITDRELLNHLLHDIGILHKRYKITKREWQCIQMLKLGKTAKETGQIIGLSRRTVESYFDNLKKKINLNSKSNILSVIS
jgi:DNA-binding CsgD family transcriptional regulator